MWTLSYRPEVEDDLVAAVDWYDRKQIGLGDDFLAEYLAAIRRVRDDPFLFAIAAKFGIAFGGVGRRNLFQDEGHYLRFTRGLCDEADRSGWLVFAVKSV